MSWIKCHECYKANKDRNGNYVSPCVNCRKCKVKAIIRV